VDAVQLHPKLGGGGCEGNNYLICSRAVALRVDAVQLHPKLGGGGVKEIINE